MKLRITKTPMMIAVVVIFIHLIVVAADRSANDYCFLKKFQSFKLKSKLRVVRIRTDDPFESPLHDCVPDFYHDQLGVRGYYLEDVEKNNKIGISEYVFKDSVAATNAYHIAYAYAESVRKTHRKDFVKRCFNMPLPQVYYASQEGSHVFIYTTVYQFIYKSGEDSVDTNIQNDKRILLDNIYLEMTKHK